MLHCCMVKGGCADLRARAVWHNPLVNDSQLGGRTVGEGSARRPASLTVPGCRQPAPRTAVAPAFQQRFRGSAAFTWPSWCNCPAAGSPRRAAATASANNDRSTLPCRPPPGSGAVTVTVTGGRDVTPGPCHAGIYGRSERRPGTSDLAGLSRFV